MPIALVESDNVKWAVDSQAGNYSFMFNLYLSNYIYKPIYGKQKLYIFGYALVKVFSWIVCLMVMVSNCFPSSTFCGPGVIM